MHRNDGFYFPAGISGQHLFHLCRIDIKTYRINIGKNWYGANSEDNPHRRKKRIRRSQHLISRPNAKAHQGYQQGIGTAGNPNSVSCPAILRYLLFKLFNFRALDITGRFNNAGDSCKNIIFEVFQLGLKI